MRIGYACQCLSNTLPKFRTCTMKFATEENLYQIITHNLMVLDEILEYNHQHHIALFRLSSDLIPFGSSPVNMLNWKEEFKETFHKLGEKAKNYHMRLSMHPGQYTLLNAINEDVLQRSIADLRYHCDILNLMELDDTSKLILHIGGIYGDKMAAIQRFIFVFHHLDEDIKQRLIIENDDRYYTLEDVLYISDKIQIPVIFDNLHHEILPSFPDLNLYQTLLLVQKSWKPKDGRMKIHYSQQDMSRRKGAHATYLDAQQFLMFCRDIRYMDVDMMLEIKTKNLAALQALDILYPEQFQQALVWKNYRYLILRHSLDIFKTITTTQQLEVRRFYELIDQALSTPIDDTQGALCYRMMMNEYLPYLNNTQKIKLQKSMQRYMEGALSEQGLKNCFMSLSAFAKDEENYLFL